MRKPRLNFDGFVREELAGAPRAIIGLHSFAGRLFKKGYRSKSLSQRKFDVVT